MHPLSDPYPVGSTHPMGALVPTDFTPCLATIGIIVRAHLEKQLMVLPLQARRACRRPEIGIFRESRTKKNWSRI
jgi:hypothetical protein